MFIPWPLIPRPSSEASNNATAATSSGVARRFCGTHFLERVDGFFSRASRSRSDSFDAARNHVSIDIAGTKSR
jgi:hypothetical protein